MGTPVKCIKSFIYLSYLALDLQCRCLFRLCAPSVVPSCQGLDHCFELLKSDNKSRTISDSCFHRSPSYSIVCPAAVWSVSRCIILFITDLMTVLAPLSASAGSASRIMNPSSRAENVGCSRTILL